MPQSTESSQPQERPAAEELKRDASSRKRFLTMMGGAGAVGALSMVLAACGDDGETSTAGGGGNTQTDSQAKSSDLEIVKYALTLEHLENAFYLRVIEAGVIKDQALAETAKRIQENEQAHVDALADVVKKMGGKAQKPKTNFDSVIEGGRDKILQTAATVENLGAAAYLGQAPKIKSKEILASALAIHSVEARHAAALNRVVGKTIVPDGAFAKPASMDEVLEQVKPFLA